jgi:hypothetical protein
MKETFFTNANGFLSPKVFRPLYRSGSMRHYHTATGISHRFSGYRVVVEVAEHRVWTAKKEIRMRLSHSV